MWHWVTDDKKQNDIYPTIEAANQTIALKLMNPHETLEQRGSFDENRMSNEPRVARSRFLGSDLSRHSNEWGD